MKLALASIALAACGGREPGVAVPGGRPAVQLVRCQPATPAPVIAARTTVGQLGTPPAPRASAWGMLGATSDGPRTGPAPVPSSRPWTPFAIETAPPIATATTVAHATEAAIRARLATLDACFTAPSPVGSIRAMLEIDAAGALTAARVGGLGDRGGEACLARALDGLTVVMPTTEPVEVACDLARGEARPWRVATDAGYDLIEVTPTQVRHGTTTLELTASEPAPLPSGPTYLVVADPAATGALLEVAASWAFEGDTTLVALRAPSGSPLLIGAARTTYSSGETFEDVAAIRATLTVSAKLVSACVHTSVHVASLADPKAVGDLVMAAATRCRRVRCASTLRVAFDGDALARDVAEVMAAARRAGFDRVLLGGPPGCDTPSIEDETP